MTSNVLIRPMAAVALLVAAGASHSAITVYTSLAAFNAAVGVTGTDTFAGMSVTRSTASPLVRNAGAYNYTATVSDSGVFFPAGTTANPALSPEIAEHRITFSGFGASVVAAGGNFYGSNIVGVFSAGDMSVTATDSGGGITRVIVGATTGSFLGFVSNGPLSSLSVAAVQPTPEILWPTIDNFVLATAVPEPQTYALLLGGLGLVGFLARRRRA